MDTSTVLVNLAFALLAAGVGAVIAARLGQSVIIGYIVAGIAIGTHTPGFTADEGTVEALADIGIVLLMFAIGIQVSAPDLLRLGRIAVFGGLTQVAISIAIAFGLTAALGRPLIEAFIVGAVVSNSSSTVLTKVLNERGETGSLHGRIGLAWSSVQDLSTIVLVVIITALAMGNGDLWSSLLLAVGQAALFLALLVPLGARILPWVFTRIGALRNREVFVLSAAATAIGMAYVATIFGLSPALGAFVAGIVLSESDIRHEILDGLMPLRDIFAGLFFVSVGMLVDPQFIVENLPSVLLVTALIVPVKGLLVAAITAAFRFPARTALLTGVTLAQSAEFSFLLARLGASQGVLSADWFSVLLASAVVSVVVSPGLHHLAQPLGLWLEQRFSPTTDVPAVDDHDGHDQMQGHAVLCGYGRVGRVIARGLRARGIPFVVIDHDHRKIQPLREQGVPSLLGSVDNETLLQQVNLERAHQLIVAIPDVLATRRIAAYARRMNPELDIVVRTHSAGERDALEAQGVQEAVLGELELALEMTRYTLRRFGVDAVDTDLLLTDLRTAPSPRQDIPQVNRELAADARLARLAPEDQP